MEVPALTLSQYAALVKNAVACDRSLYGDNGRLIVVGYLAG